MPCGGSKNKCYFDADPTVRQYRGNPSHQQADSDLSEDKSWNYYEYSAKGGRMVLEYDWVLV